MGIAMYRCMGCMKDIEGEYEVCPLCGYIKNTPPREAYHLPPETVLQGRYLVGKVLGYGGFGVTYIGFDAVLERIVAIKEFLPSTFATRVPGETLVTVYQGEATNQFGAGLHRFVEEAQTLAQFNGIPGIVDIYDSFVGNNTAYIVMQYLYGKDVKGILNEEGPMEYERASDIILHICDTLIPVHAQNIIHRDISPDNIFITNDGEIKLLDFGAARYESSVNSKSLSVILKSGYAPEEQYRSKGEQGSWTDVYALAATFYKMLTGQTPQDSMERAILDELIDPSKLGAVMPESAENTLLNALCVRKTDRIQTVSDFKKALLSDGIERVKVKQVKVNTGKVPTGAKVAIIIGVMILVSLGLFTATGGFGETIIVGGTMLEDDFGEVDSGEFATVPNLVGMTEEEAEKALEEQGLLMEIASWEFGEEEVTEVIVYSQETLANSKVKKGETIQLGMNVGNPIWAMEQGYVPDIREMEFQEYNILTRNFYWGQYGFNYIYEYSDTVEKGKIITIEKETNEEEYHPYNIVVSVGPKESSTEYGTLQWGFIESSSLQLVISNIASEDTELNIETSIYISANQGTDWTKIQEGISGAYYNDDKSNSIYTDYVDLAKSPKLYQEEFMGKELMVKVERYRNDDGVLGEMIDTCILENTIECTYREELIIGDMEEISWEEAKEVFLTEDPNNWFFSDENQQYLEERVNDYTCYRIDGNFGNDYYNIYEESEYEYSYYGNIETCIYDECLYVVVDSYYFEYQQMNPLVVVNRSNYYTGEFVNDGVERVQIQKPVPIYFPGMTQKEMEYDDDSDSMEETETEEYVDQMLLEVLEGNGVSEYDMMNFIEEFAENQDQSTLECLEGEILYMYLLEYGYTGDFDATQMIDFMQYME
ncbi:MAG: protein kinase [Eubacteriales bacterium]